MAALVLGGVSPRSLGDMLKGFGVMAALGEVCPRALFWWDDAYHLVVDRPCDNATDQARASQAIEEVLSRDLVEWGKQVAKAFKPLRGDKRKGIERQPSKLKARSNHDQFDPRTAAWARAISLAEADKDETNPHVLFPAHGQEGSGDYFAQLEKAAEEAEHAQLDIKWSLFAEGAPALKSELDSGYLFFPEPMKRYATGVEKWEREKDAAVSPWCFLLAMRGAMLLRGSLRRLRWGRRPYPAFPFMFDGSIVETGGGKFFQNFEIHLPTWGADRPRTLAEFEMQMRHFQARLSGRGFAATAAEFRAAVVGRGTGAAFDAFHRFVLEGRRPGQRQPMRQAIPRGITRVGGKGKTHANLRLMLAPLAESGWFDQFGSDFLGAERTRAEEAIHRAVDEPELDAYCGILEALWRLNRSLVLRASSGQGAGSRKQTRPLPPLPAKLWERALQDGWQMDPAHRLGRAIGSILGVRGEKARVGPILEHMLPIEYSWEAGKWVVPESSRSRSLRWAGLDPIRDFRELFWFRWLDSAELPRLPFSAARSASLDDIAALLRGEVNAREVHRLAALYALLDWQSLGISGSGSSNSVRPVSPSYAALRLWLELGIDPPADLRPPRDGAVARLMALGAANQVERAVAIAIARLAIAGLPWPSEQRPTAKAVARFSATIPAQEAAIMLLAVLVPISKEDTFDLSRRLWVPIEEKEFST